MEVEVNISDVLKIDQDGFICLSGKDYMKHFRPQHHEKGLQILSKIISTLGQNSAISQKLKQVITTSIKFFGTQHRIYIKVQGNKALGFVKVGQKKLFYHDYVGQIKQLYPTAVLDIYVHQSCQRTGIGKEIFQKFLKIENKVPQKLAYDRPSQKLISFLKKHYGLASFIPQNNNYVIFDRFFSKGQKIQKTQKSQKNQKTFYNNHNVKRPMQTLSLNTTKLKAQQEDSLVKLTKQMQQLGMGGSYKQIKDQTKSSFGCPWAIEQKLPFRTTSNAYGNYYKRK